MHVAVFAAIYMNTAIKLLPRWNFDGSREKICPRNPLQNAYFQLNYGAFDLILTPNGRYIFLEINPVGEFYWLEKHAGLPISQAIADILIKSPPF